MRDNEKGRQDLQDQLTKVITNEAGITARICPGGACLSSGWTHLHFVP